ncbi:MAG TPA: hypothetical protein VKN36_16125 [Eudoraea sp.]|nr:hypothetical protein [Eudoraea sp.]
MKKVLNDQRKIITQMSAMFVMFLVLATFGCSNDDGPTAPWETEVTLLRTAMEPIRDFEAAINAGYDIKATEYRTQMGFHYLNAGLLDGLFEVERPEVLIFIEDTSGEMELVAVEYGIPIEDLENPPPPPEGFSGTDDVWKIDTEFSLWTLHAWVVMENPEGIFVPRNPILP